jgi:hypothetical protein
MKQQPGPEKNVQVSQNISASGPQVQATRANGRALIGVVHLNNTEYLDATCRVMPV